METEKDTAVILTPTPATLLQLAVEKGADIDKLEKLMELQERWEAQQAKKAYTAAMLNFREKCPVINKSKIGFGYKYATLSQTIEQIKNLLSVNGLSFNWHTKQDQGLVEVTCIVTHVDGHSESTSLNFKHLAPTQRQNSIQAFASTISYLERYTLYAILGLTSAEMDSDGSTIVESYITDEQALEIKELLAKTDADETKFMKWIGADKIEHIKDSSFATAITALKKKTKKEQSK